MPAVVVSTEEVLLPPTVTVRGAGSVVLPFCQEKASEFTESGGAAVPVIERNVAGEHVPCAKRRARRSAEGHVHRTHRQIRLELNAAVGRVIEDGPVAGWNRQGFLRPRRERWGAAVPGGGEAYVGGRRIRILYRTMVPV